MTENDEKLRRFLAEHKPVPREPARDEKHVIWNAIEDRPRFYRRAVGYLAPIVALVLMVLWLGHFITPELSQEDRVANVATVEEALSLSFMEEDDEVDFYMASIDE